MDDDGYSAREALRMRDYRAAAEYARKHLVEDSRSLSMNHMLSKPTFARLGAALGDESLLQLFDSHIGGSDAMAGYWEDLVTCRWVMTQLETESIVDFKTLNMRALRDERPRLKTMLTWMEKVGHLHIADDQVVLGNAPPEVPVVKPPSSIPEFNAYYSTSKDMGPEQRIFYAGFRSEFMAGNALNLEGNLSYGFVLLNELLQEVLADPERVAQALGLAAKSYPGTGLERYAKRWQSEVWLSVGDFQRGYDSLLENEVLQLDQYLTLEPHVENSHLTLPLVKFWLGADLGLTSFGKSKHREIEVVTLSLLDSFHADTGQSTIADLWHRFILSSEREVDAINIENDFGDLLLPEELTRCLEFFEARKDGLGNPARQMRGLAFQGATEAAQLPIAWPTPLVDSGGFVLLAEARLRILFRDAENTVRVREGLPEIGMGWVSEVNLLNQLREAFPKHTIVHQGRPSWLGLQSLDIYFPEDNVAVEYQGLQHSEPVERFGGNKAFENQIAETTESGSFVSRMIAY